jgi:hypothetical protein
LVTVLLASGLMAAIFFSSRAGFDRRASRITAFGRPALIATDDNGQAAAPDGAAPVLSQAGAFSSNLSNLANATANTGEGDD